MGVNMNIQIREIKNDHDEILAVKSFLYDQIMKEYGIGPTPEFHYDIEGIKEYYISPKRNNFYVAFCGEKIVATADSKEDTASIWRLMVDKDYRRHGLARKLVNEMEEFAKKEGYKRIYLHTHRYLEAAPAFWDSLGYEITIQEDDYDETNHMVKNLV